jgi:hypothetical protein
MVAGRKVESDPQHPEENACRASWLAWPRVEASLPRQRARGPDARIDVATDSHPLAKRVRALLANYAVTPMKTDD